MAKILSTEWIEKTREEYRKGKSDPDTFKFVSTFGRHHSLDAFLRSEIDKMLKLNILYVGLGRDESTDCASGPFELAALLEGADRTDYRMVLMDSDAESLDAAIRREEIFCRADETKFSVDFSWFKYLDHTKQKPSRSGYRSGEKVVLADIPLSFKQKKLKGEVRFIREDLVERDVNFYGSFDLIICLNVLSHINPNNAKVVAIDNIGRNLSENGILIVDNSTILDKMHGWSYESTKPLIEQMGGYGSTLKITGELSSDTFGYSYLVLRNQLNLLNVVLNNLRNFFKAS